MKHNFLKYQVLSVNDKTTQLRLICDTGISADISLNNDSPSLTRILESDVNGDYPVKVIHETLGEIDVNVLMKLANNEGLI